MNILNILNTYHSATIPICFLGDFQPTGRATTKRCVSRNHSEQYSCGFLPLTIQNTTKEKYGYRKQASEKEHLNISEPSKSETNTRYHKIARGCSTMRSSMIFAILK